MNNYNPKISIIVPVYKAEKYLRRCLDSILAQTFADWECILIDDGSPDNSRKICDEYNEIDARFRVIHQENAGVSAARNAGLNVALGDWIGFVDSDDWIDPETYQTALDAATKYCADVVQWGFFLNDGNVDYEATKYKEGEIFTPVMNCVWCSLIKKNLFLEHEISFPCGIRIAEDMFVMVKLMYFSAKTYILSDVFYHYFQNCESATHTNISNKLEDECRVVDSIDSFLLSRSPDKKWLAWLSSTKFSTKNKYLFNLEKPDFHSWRCKYREVFPSLLKKVPLRQKFFFLMVYLHMDTLANKLIKIRFNLKNKNGRIQFKMQ